MPFNVIPANDTGLPAITQLGEEPSLSSLDLAEWCASIGRITADVLTILTPMPASSSVIAWFEAEMREEVGAAIDATTDATEEQRHHLTQVAWLAFDRRLALHQRSAPLGGAA